MTPGGRRAHPTLEPTETVRACEAVTRREARNFWYGIRLLPPTKRRALATVYAVARRIDDIGDGELPLDEKRRALDAMASTLRAPDASADDPVIAALGQTMEVCDLPLDAFASLVRGVHMDLDGTVYRSIDDLVSYCRCVAGSIGRLSLAVFTLDDDRGDAEDVRLADDLGVALQLTNILRDVREDYDMGRVYLPADDLERFGVAPEQLASADAPPAGADLIRFEAARAGQWFDRGLPLLRRLDRRSAACVGAMAGIYRRLLDRIERQPEAVFRERMSVPTSQKLLVASRALAGIGVRGRR